MYIFNQSKFRLVQIKVFWTKWFNAEIVSTFEKLALLDLYELQENRIDADLHIGSTETFYMS